MLTLALTIGLFSALIQTPQIPVPSHDINDTAVRLVLCKEGLGTAWVIKKDILATAEHVANMTDCKDAETNRPLRNYHMDVKNDFALMTMDTGTVRPIKYSCARFRTLNTYMSYGYGGGQYEHNPLLATGIRTDEDFMVGGRDGVTPMPGMRHLYGRIIGGASGGPIVDRHGVAHGINNVSDGKNDGYSYELRDTILCKGR